MISHKSSPDEFECNEIDNYILKRLNHGLSTHILVTGLGGRGKSSFAVRTAERLSQRIKNGVEFTYKDIVDSLLKLLERITKIKFPGEIIVIEEVSVLFSSRRSMAGDNVAIGQVLDTIRKKRVILLSNAPLFQSIDLHMRAMSDVLVECKKVIKSKKLIKLKAWKLQTAPHTGKTYRHRFKRGRRDIMFHYCKKPSDEIWIAYEREKDRFLLETYKKMQQKAELKLKKENKELRGVSTEKEKRNNEIWFRYAIKKQPIRVIANNFGISERQINNIVRKKRENGQIYMENQENEKEIPNPTTT